MMDDLRRAIGGRLIYMGHRILPAPTRKSVSLMAELGILWVSESEETFLAAQRGEMVNVCFQLAPPLPSPESK